MKATLFRLLSALPLLCLAASAFAAVGDIDPGFGADGVAHVPIGATMLGAVGPLVQPDGKILVCGIGAVTANNWTVALYRFDADGLPDTTFGDAGSVVVPSNSRFPDCEAIGRQSDGRLIVAATGVANDDAHDAETQVFRFDTVGVADASFGDDGVAHVNFQTDASSDFVTSIAIEPDDAIVVGAPLAFSFGAFRLDANGHADTTFAAGGRAIITFDDPTLSMIAGNSTVNVDGQGRILMTGTVAGSNSFIENFAAARLNADGTPDASFGSGGLVVVDIGDHDAHASSAMLDDAGRIVLTGSAGVPPVNSIFPNYNVAALRLLDDGALDTSFGDGGLTLLPIDLVQDGTDGALAGIELDGGKVLVVGTAGTDNGGGNAFALQLDANGAPDSDFGTSGLRVYSFVSNAQTHQSFTGIARDGSGFAVTGTLVDSVSAEIGFVARLDGPTLFGHSTHSRAGMPMFRFH